MEKEERLAYQREWKKTHPEYRKRQYAYQIEWRKAHPDCRKNQNNDYLKKWREAHPGYRKKQNNAYMRGWRKANPEKVKALKQARRAKKSGNGGSFTAQEWQELLYKYGHKCLCCSQIDVKLAADHILSIAKGGTGNIRNIQPLCKSCNSKKNARYADYRQEYFSDWT